MAEHKHKRDPNFDIERRNMDLTAVVRVAIGLFLTILFVGVVCVWLLQIWHIPYVLDRPEVIKRLPPEPRLQIDEPADYRAFHAQEDRLLNGYSWVDRESGVVRMPIEQAMDKVAQKGLPSRGEK